jgi:hypothetical protein
MMLLSQIRNHTGVDSHHCCFPSICQGQGHARLDGNDEKIDTNVSLALHAPNREIGDNNGR